MKQAVAVFVFVCALGMAAPAKGQTSAPATHQGQFSLTATAMSLPGIGETVAATDAGANFAITERFSLRSDNVLSGSGNVYAGGVQYFPNLAKLFAKTKLNPASIEPYITASAGVNRFADAAGKQQQHIAILAGGGFNYVVNGTLSFGAELRFARFPEMGGNTAIAAVGPSLHF